MERGRDQTGPGEPAPGATLDAAAVAALYAEHGAELRRFVLGVLRDPDMAGDVVQATFARAIQRGHTAQADSLRGWLYRVALNEALMVRRQRAAGDRARRHLASAWSRLGETPEDDLIRGETVEAVRRVVEALPEEQRYVVLARMYQDKTFAQIAAELGVPLGTVLTRMRRALGRLRRALGTGEQGS